jgi:hypothetical protein
LKIALKYIDGRLEVHRKQFCYKPGDPIFTAMQMNDKPSFKIEEMLRFIFSKYQSNEVMLYSGILKKKLSQLEGFLSIESLSKDEYVAIVNYSEEVINRFWESSTKFGSFEHWGVGLLTEGHNLNILKAWPKEWPGIDWPLYPLQRTGCFDISGIRNFDNGICTIYTFKSEWFDDIKTLVEETLGVKAE